MGTIYCVTVTIPERPRPWPDFCFDPAGLLDGLVREFGTDVTVCLEDAMQKRVDWMREHDRKSAALESALNDAHHRGPCWSFRVRTGTDQIIIGQAERYYAALRSEQPIPEPLATRFMRVADQLRFVAPQYIRRDESGEHAIGGEISWAVAELFPRQGDWLEEEYLRLPGNRHVELIDRRLEVLPFPGCAHQGIVGNLLWIIGKFVKETRVGKLLPGPFALRLRKFLFRSADLCFKLSHKLQPGGERYWESADLVVEVVSPDNPNRDWVEKLADYAAARIPEYWIADPRDQTLTIFTLDAGATEYHQAGRCAVGETAESVLLPGLTVDVAAAFTDGDAADS